MKIKFLLISALTFCLSGVVFAQEVLVTPEAQRGYLVGPGDVVAVKVLGEEQFDTTATVDEDGNIEVPFFDKSVMAQCRSERELRTDIGKLLAKYLRNPQVSVRVMERKSRPPATIYGEVRQQQQIVLTRKARLLEILSFAGGVTEKAGGTIQIFRTQAQMCSDGDASDNWNTANNNGLDVPSRMYSLNSVRQGLDEANPVIYPGDIVVVQKAMPVYIVGEVNAVGELPLSEGGLPLTEAIAKVGGVRREAKTKDIKIYRLKSNSKEREIITANYNLIKKGEQKDIMLEPYDIVEVDKTKKSITQILLEVATGGLKSAANVLPVNILR
jgi:polysaccharide biosynthesis/export protein